MKNTFDIITFNNPCLCRSVIDDTINKQTLFFTFRSSLSDNNAIDTFSRLLNKDFCSAAESCLFCFSPDNTCYLFINAPFVPVAYLSKVFHSSNLTLKKIKDPCRLSATLLRTFLNAPYNKTYSFTFACKQSSF